MARVDGEVEFWCWDEKEDYSTDSFMIIADGWETLLKSDCPYCSENHVVEWCDGEWM